jgi:hypothetical protein
MVRPRTTGNEWEGADPSDTGLGKRRPPAGRALCLSCCWLVWFFRVTARELFISL